MKYLNDEKNRLNASLRECVCPVFVYVKAIVVLGGVAACIIHSSLQIKTSHWTIHKPILLQCLHFLVIFFFLAYRKRSVSVSSRSSSDDSLDLPKRRKKSGRRKLDEVERLAEMERQRRQKEVEQKVFWLACNFPNEINYLRRFGWINQKTISILYT